MRRWLGRWLMVVAVLHTAFVLFGVALSARAVFPPAIAAGSRITTR